MTLWAFLALFSLHDGWKGAVANFVLIGLAIAMIRNAFLAHAQLWDGFLKFAISRLLESIIAGWAFFAGFFYLATTEI